MGEGKRNEQARRRSAERLAAQKERGSKRFKKGSNPHNGGSRGNSGQPSR